MVASFSSIAALIAGQLVALILFFAGIGKLRDRESAKRSVEAYGLFPVAAARFVGAVLPWIEVAIGVSLISGVVAGLGALAAVCLLLVFSLAQAIVLLRGQQVPCGCFGSLSTRPVRWANVLANVAMAASCLFSTLPHSDFWNNPLFGHAGSLRAAVSMSVWDVPILQLLSAALFTELQMFRQILENRREEQEHARHQRALYAALAIQRAVKTTEQ